MSITRRRTNEWMIATGAPATTSRLSTNSDPVMVLSPTNRPIVADTRLMTNTTTATRHTLRLELDADSAASRVAPWRMTATSGTQSPVGPTARKTKVAKSRSRTMPKRYAGTRVLPRAAARPGVLTRSRRAPSASAMRAPARPRARGGTPRRALGPAAVAGGESCGLTRPASGAPVLERRHLRRRSSLDVRVLLLVLGEQRLLLVLLRVEEEDECRAEHDRDDTGRVGPVGAVDERRLRAGEDLVRVLRVQLGDVLGAGEGLLELGLGRVADLVAVRRGRDRAGDRCGVARGEECTEDRLHDGAAEVALKVGGSRGHAGAFHRDRSGE